MPSHPGYDANDRLAILLHGGISGKHGKTGLALLRFAPERVVAVIDAEHAGGSLTELTDVPLPQSIPIVASAAEALRFAPQTLAIGIAPLGGKLPQDWYPDLMDALKGGLNILNGLHTKLAEDPRLTACLQTKNWIWDIRNEPTGLVSGSGKARLLSCKRVLFVGTDMSIGKMSAAIAFHRAAMARGLRSKFMATGQTGIMLEGDGIPLDAIRIDFASGAVEGDVLACGQAREVVFIEGQGSMLNPASTATLPLIRGSQPTHLVLVHRAGMQTLRDFSWVPIPPLSKVVEMYEQVAKGGGAFEPVRVACIALNTHRMTEEQAKREIADAQLATGLPVSDVVRFGAESLLDTL